MFRETDINTATAVEIEVYYKISDEDDVLEETVIKTQAMKNCYSATKFNFGNNGMIIATLVDVIDNSVILKFNTKNNDSMSNLDFTKIFTIPDNVKYHNNADEIVIENGKAIKLNHPINSFYSKQYTIGIKSIKYGEFLEG